MASYQAELELYGYYRSSCSGRVRLSLSLKGLRYKYVPINIDGGRQNDTNYITLNPNQSVPTLTVQEDGKSRVTIGQSWAALEYLEEAFPSHRKLMPEDAYKRAAVRELAMIILSDTQPVTNTRVTKQLGNWGHDTTAWIKLYFDRGFKAYEATCKQYSGAYSVGDEMTLADICLLPAVWNALRVGMSLDDYPTVKRIHDVMKDMPEVQAAHWANQPDTPSHEKT